MIRKIPRVPRGFQFFARPLGCARAAALALLLAIFCFLAAHGSGATPLSTQLQDANSKPTPAPTAQQPAPATSKPSGQTPKDATPLKKAVHEKKVITEEDLAKPERPALLTDEGGEEVDPLCDLSCESELRSELGFTPGRELEFRNQLTLARQEISNDHAWNSDLGSATRAAGLYCDLQRQKAQILAKGKVAQPIRDDVTFRFAERERDLSGQYRNFEGLLKERIAAVQRFAPFRATIMQYEWNAAAASACPNFNLP